MSPSVRLEELERLNTLVNAAPAGVSVVDLHGPGGVGKSFLVDTFLEQSEPASRGWLVLKVDAPGASSRTELFSVLTRLFPPALPPPVRPGVDLFPHLRAVERAHRKLIDAATLELEQREDCPPELRKTVLSLLRAGRRLNRMVPLTREYLNVAALGTDESVSQHLDEAWEIAGSLKAVAGAGWLPGPLRTALGMTLASRVRVDLHGAITDALLVDLSAALKGWQRKDWYRLVEPPVAGLDRLLVVIDDFEALAPVLQEWLLSSFLGALSAASFPSLVMIVGRDPLQAMHPGWGQQARRWLRASIALAPFQRADAEAFLEEAGVPRERWEALWEETRGYPFLLALLVEPEADGSALGLRRFHERTTRWMTPRERERFDQVCYLDRIDGDTLRRLFPDQEADEVLAWFEREPSVRDPDAPFFTVRPLIRRRVLQYLEVRHPSLHRERVRRAEGEGG